MLASGSEHARGSGCDDGFERDEQIAGDVDGPMKGHRQRPGQFHKLPRTLYIDGAICAEQSQDDAICAEIFCDASVMLHGCEFRIGVEEVATSRPDHYVDCDLCVLARCADGSGAGSGTAFEQVCTEFDALRASAIGGDH